MEEGLDKKILSDLTIYAKYARYVDGESRRETWAEIVERNKQMHITKYPFLKEEISKVYDEYVLTKKVLPSARSLQFAGRAIEVTNVRIFNCSYLHIDSLDAFSESAFLLLAGTGVGFSPKKKHIEKLPPLLGVEKPVGKQSKKRFLIGDSIEGWADSFKVLFEAYFYGKREIDFDYRDIRHKGARLLLAGGKAPGPAPLRKAHTQVIAILENALQERGSGTKLTSLEVHDIMCVIADCVRSGGIRRAALISLFDKEDIEMLESKSGEWWVHHAHRALANNSAHLSRDTTTKEQFKHIWHKIEVSGAGEPGIAWTNDLDIGGNPCFEVSLKPFSFCNLTEVNSSIITTQDEFNNAVKAASFIGTLQASYTDFHYLRPIWRETTEEDSLIGVGLTGVANSVFMGLDFKQASEMVLQENERVANLLGINKAARTTVIKPAGTTSLVLGTSSGVHAWYDEYYIRRMTLGKNESLAKFLMTFHPELVEQSEYDEREIKVCVPQKAPEGAMLRHESAIETLERGKKLNLEWIRGGHRSGTNYNNVSTTINVDKHEWEEVGEWMWDNRETYTGIAVLPKDNGTYRQAPFEPITKERYEELVKHLQEVDLSCIIEDDDETDLTGEVACGGGGCTVT